MPNLLVFRPADSIEVVECWQLALTLKEPSVLVLSRQNVPALPRQGKENDNAVGRGGYVVFAEGDEQITLLASGSEVQLALEAGRRLSEQGVGYRVVSMPCCALFERLSVS